MIKKFVSLTWVEKDILKAPYALKIVFCRKKIVSRQLVKLSNSH